MTRERILEQLNSIFQEVFDDETIIVDETTSSADIADWDSLEHINLIVAVEKQFEIKFDINEINKMKNVGDMINVVVLRLG